MYQLYVPGCVWAVALNYVTWHTQHKQRKNYYFFAISHDPYARPVFTYHIPLPIPDTPHPSVLPAPHFRIPHRRHISSDLYHAKSSLGSVTKGTRLSLGIQMIFRYEVRGSWEINILGFPLFVYWYLLCYSRSIFLKYWMHIKKYSFSTICLIWLRYLEKEQKYNDNDFWQLHATMSLNGVYIENTPCKMVKL